jgi:hypothetical protein
MTFIQENLPLSSINNSLFWLVLYLRTLENLYAEVDMHRAWQTVTENIRISAKESVGHYKLKKHKPWVDEGCSELLDHRKQAKLQWLQDLRELNWDNLNNVRRETYKNFRNKKREHLKDKINELPLNSKNIGDLYRRISEFKRGYHGIENPEYCHGDPLR